MGMTGNFVSLSSDDFNAVLEQPSLAVCLVEFQLEDAAGEFQRMIQETRRLISDPNTSAEIKERYKMLLQSLETGAKSNSDDKDEWKPGPGTKFLDIDKSWDALNALLTLNEPENSPLGFILAGGREIPSDDFGYGPPHGFTAKETKEIARRLQTLDSVSLITSKNLKEIEGQDLYCFSGGEEEAEYLRNYLDELKIFVAAAAKSNQAMVVFLA